MKTIYEMFSNLTGGKTVPGVSSNQPLPSDPKERMWSLYWQHRTMLNYLKLVLADFIANYQKISPQFRPSITRLSLSEEFLKTQTCTPIERNNLTPMVKGRTPTIWVDRQKMCVVKKYQRRSFGLSGGRISEKNCSILVFKMLIILLCRVSGVRVRCCRLCVRSTCWSRLTTDCMCPYTNTVQSLTPWPNCSPEEPFTPQPRTGL